MQRRVPRQAGQIFGADGPGVGIAGTTKGGFRFMFGGFMQ